MQIMREKIHISLKIAGGRPPRGGVPNCEKMELKQQIAEVQLFCWVCDIKFTRQGSLIAHLGTKKHVNVS